MLERTGLHRERQGEWGFAEPEELMDRGLRRVWETLEAFFTRPSAKPKKLSDLIRRLAGPPIGVPSGVMPVLVMAGYRAFARNVSLCSDGDYVPDILGFDANRMFAEPERHKVEIHDASPPDAALPFGVGLRVHARAAMSRPTKRCNSPMTPSASGGPRCPMARAGRVACRKRRRSSCMPSSTPVSRPSSPGSAGPDMFGGNRKDLGVVVDTMECVRNEINSIVEGYVDEAVDILGEAFRVGAADDAMTGLQSWVACLDVDDLMLRDDLRLTDKAILRTARDTINGRYTPQSLARTISAILLQRGFEQWQDSTGGQYAMLVRECRTRIEDASLASGRPNRRLEPIIRNRIDALEAMLARLQKSDGCQAAAGGER